MKLKKLQARNIAAILRILVVKGSAFFKSLAVVAAAG